MRRCETVEMIADALRKGGPMTAKELSEALGVPSKALQGAIKHMSADGSIYIYARDRQKGHTWASRRVI